MARKSWRSHFCYGSCVDSCWKPKSRRAVFRRGIYRGTALLALLYFAFRFTRNSKSEPSCKPVLEFDLESVHWTRKSRVNISSQVTALRHFSKKYSHLYEENITIFFNHLKMLKKQTWKPQGQNRQEFRNCVHAALGKEGSIKNFLLTKNNIEKDEEMCFYLHGNIQTFPPALMEFLPENQIYKPGQFASCSVVGSSGILRDSRCGKAIDQSQAVFRCNLAPTRGFEADVGSKTNFTTLNPSYLKKYLNRLRTQEDLVHFGAILKQFKDSYLWLPAFSADYDIPIIIQTAQFAVHSMMAQPVLGHPQHYLSVRTLWRTSPRAKRFWPTTGLYLILSLVDVCDRINVFGFWPYSTAIDGSDVPYHYHNDINALNQAHTYDAEFKMLVHLYEHGIINMHLGSCV
ncbi:CMP-N-acetylneuraminate-poly-alpha-2,8-sialyltransferase-like [Acanthaster planci]|uniref:CMP-N-acetylneuraminate-poly-alpha-2, 8-sialyltransferase-like n=1 Tax=Acanthaster planci TaxID=133434 RepID=A0A8B7YIN1_ACAPL|nr:CMP-N-acetylneuraminate-poly-alpha-2,8-sialyltransferase-like [Acanthaster planci]XP_022093110.1 CMP-N-acetylneuraminate-poly-alpha-2,8-sialyltransferase-like [Acanthaster planci]